MDIKLVFKKLFRPLGFDPVRLKNVPRVTFLGLTDRRFDSILDVGANDGGFVKWVVPFFPHAKLHCFEPLPAPADTLRKWAERNHKPLAVHEIALSDFEGEAEILEHVDHSTSSSLLPATTESVALFPFTARAAKRPIKVTTLDAWCGRSATDLGRILLKLDVQGLEDRVLRGGATTLAAVDVCLVEVSIAHLYHGQATFVTLVDLLHAAGLSYYGNLEQMHDERGAPLFIDCVFVRPAV
jgi:FkbM family methyltransferase